VLVRVYVYVLLLKRIESFVWLFVCMNVFAADVVKLDL
jgi:hypothetical protein